MRKAEEEIAQVRNEWKKSVYELVTEQILHLLERGTIPWKQQWQTGRPQNFQSKRPYTGFNALYLSALQELNRWKTPYYLTYRSIRERGWHVRKGQKGNLVVFWKIIEKTAIAAEGEEEKKYYRVLRYYWVWNLDQVEGVRPEDFLEIDKDNQPVLSCEDLISNFITGLPEIRAGPPSYSPKEDIIYLPEKSAFKTPESYYSTRFHETIHSTGAVQRLNRAGVAGGINFGSESYSFEELVAELGAAFLSALSGISNMTQENEAAYIQHWLKKLKDNPTWVVKAASQAQRAVDYLMGEGG